MPNFAHTANIIFIRYYELYPSIEVINNIGRVWERQCIDILFVKKYNIMCAMKISNVILISRGKKYYPQTLVSK